MHWLAVFAFASFLQACEQAAEAPAPEHVRDDTREIINLDARAGDGYLRVPRLPLVEARASAGRLAARHRTRLDPARRVHRHGDNWSRLRD